MTAATATKLNKHLTPAAHRMLKQIRDGEDKYAIAEGREVWVDYERFSPRTLFFLIRLCLIQPESFGGGKKTEVWYLNSEGEQIIDDPTYVPLIHRAMKPEASRDNQESVGDAPRRRARRSQSRVRTSRA